MPWISVQEPFAAAPRVAADPSAREAAPAWKGPLELDRGWAEFDGAHVDGTADGAERFEDCEELVISDSLFRTVTFAPEGELVIEATNSTFEKCDLSRTRFRSMRRVTVKGCRLGGTDFGEAILQDVAFVDCSLRYTNLRSAKLERVSFQNCAFDDVDASQAVMTDVDFAGSQLRELNIDRVKATRVDLRTVRDPDLRTVRSLKGFLVTEAQLPSLVWLMSAALDLGVEQRDQR